jgi:hypothetical protein
MLKWIKRILQVLLFTLLVSLLLGRSDSLAADKIEQVRAYTRMDEFDFISWTVNALWVKVTQASLATPGYLTPAEQRQVIYEYLKEVERVNQITAQINALFANPAIKDPHAQSLALRQTLDQENARMAQLAPLAEAVLESQVAVIAAQDGLTLGGQPIPPILYHSTNPPDALIISPRSQIRQDADISLNPGLATESKDALENRLQKNLGVSALVVGIGGIGLYPTMVLRTTDLNWLAETISHEWIHNYLTLRPLGISYDASPVLRSINETTASLAGREIGQALIRRYYPERAPQPPQPDNPGGQNSNGGSTPAQPVFNFNAEMHLTRITVEQMLAEGKIDQAESYMETRRQFLWTHGYQIRKINQAYFAFYGAYNDVSNGGNANGSAGNDPVGPAVVTFRKKFTTLGEFINRISWITSLDQLQAAAH